MQVIILTDTEGRNRRKQRTLYRVNLPATCKVKCHCCLVGNWYLGIINNFSTVLHARWEYNNNLVLGDC
nr:unnamed protein product [Callosobruchus chinensis]